MKSTTSDLKNKIGKSWEKCWPHRLWFFQISANKRMHIEQGMLGKKWRIEIDRPWKRSWCTPLLSLVPRPQKSPTRVCRQETSRNLWSGDQTTLYSPAAIFFSERGHGVFSSTCVVKKQIFCNILHRKPTSKFNNFHNDNCTDVHRIF